MNKEKLQARLKAAGLTDDVVKGLVDEITAPAAVDKVEKALSAMRGELSRKHSDELTKALGAKDGIIDALSKGLANQAKQSDALSEALKLFGEGVAEKLGTVTKALESTEALATKVEELGALVKAIGEQPATQAAVTAMTIENPGEDAAAAAAAAAGDKVDTVEKGLALGARIERKIRDELSKGSNRARREQLVKGLTDLSSSVHPAKVAETLSFDIK